MRSKKSPVTGRESALPPAGGEERRAQIAAQTEGGGGVICRMGVPP